MSLLLEKAFFFLVKPLNESIKSRYVGSLIDNVRVLLIFVVEILHFFLFLPVLFPSPTRLLSTFDWL